MDSDFLGRGWSFPIALDRDSHILMTADEKNIRDSIWIILATSPGERVMRPDFGCRLHDLVFSVNDAAMNGQVTWEVHQALVRWEPRIDVLDVDVEARGRNEEALLITVHYRVRLTNNYFNLVYPFYLSGSQQ
jgi:uncharacterized protein